MGWVSVEENSYGQRTLGRGSRICNIFRYIFLRRLLWEECIVYGPERGERPMRRLPSFEEMMVAQSQIELGKYEWS